MKFHTGCNEKELMPSNVSGWNNYTLKKRIGLFAEYVSHKLYSVSTYLHGYKAMNNFSNIAITIFHTLYVLNLAQQNFAICCK
jgi:hypothetical protein